MGRVTKLSLADELVENTREDTITDDSYFTQWEQDIPEQFNVDDTDGHEIGPVHTKSKPAVDEEQNETN